MKLAKLSVISICLLLLIGLLVISCSPTTPSSSSAPASSSAPPPTTSKPAVSTTAPAAPSVSTPASSPATAKPAAKTIEFRFGHESSPQGKPNQDLFLPWAADIDKATNGRVKVTVYPGSALGPVNTYMDAATSGMIDIVWISLEYFEGRLPLSMVGYNPIGIKSPGTKAYVWWDLYKEFPEIQKEYAGMKVLTIYGGAPKQIWASKRFGKDIQTLEDVKGMKIRVGGGPFTEAAKAIGATPISMPGSEQYEALQKGTLDGSWFELSMGPNFMLEDVCRSVTRVNMPAGGFAILMNPESYAKMSAEDQKIFDNLCGDSLADRVSKLWTKWENTTSDYLTQKGVKIIDPQPVEYDKFQNALGSLADKWAAQVNGKGLPGTKVITRAKELAAKYESMVK